jgi:uncharacterized protein involved in outer membrane biogenesis
MKAEHLKKLSILLTVLAVLVIGAIIVIPKLVDLNKYQSLIAEEITKAVGGEVKLGNIQWGFQKGIWVAMDGFSISGSSRLPGDLNIARIYCEVAAIPLMSKKVVVKILQLESPDATIQLKPASGKGVAPKEVPPEVEPGEAAAAPSLPVEIMIQEVSLKNGHITVEDKKTQPGEKKVHTFSDVNVVVTDLIPGQKIPFRIDLRDEAETGLGRLAAQGTFSGLTEALTLEAPELDVKATISSLYTEAVKPYLKDNPWIQGLHGSIMIDISLKSDFGGNFQSQGFIDLGKTVYQDPVSGEKMQPKAGTKIAYNMALSDNRLTVENFDLMWANLSLKTAAVVENLQKGPTIKNFKLSANLPLKELAYIIPWKKLGAHGERVREVFEGGGNITIEKASIPDSSFAQLSAHPEALISDALLAARFSGISGRLIPRLPGVKDVGGMVRLENGVVDVGNFTGTIGVTRLPAITAKITGLPESPKVQAQLTGAFVVGAKKDDETKIILKALGIERISGAGDTDLSMHFAVGKPEDMQVNGRLSLKGFRLKTSLIPAVFEDIHMETAITADALEISDCALKVTIPAGKTSPKGQFKLSLNGKVTNWRNRPKLVLNHLKTTAISLPSMVSVVPWDALGEYGDRVKEILLAGGTISVERLKAPPVDLTSPPKDIDSLTKRLDAMIRVADINIKRGPNLPGIEGITGHLSLKKGVLSADKIALRIGPIALPDLNVRADHLFTKPKIDAHLKGHIRIGTPPIPKFKELLLAYGFKDVTGDADISLKAGYDHAKPEQWTAEGTIAVKDLNAVSHPGGVVMRKLNADLAFKRNNRLYIHIKKLSTQINDSPVRLQGSLSAQGLKKIDIDAKAYAKALDLEHLLALSPALKDTGLNLKGRMTMDVDIHLASQNPAETKMTGTVETHDLGFLVKAAGLTVKGLNADLDLKGDTVYINSMTANVNEQTLSLVGQTTRPLVEPRAQLALKAAELDLDKLLPPVKKEPDDSKASPATQPEQKADGKKSVSKSDKIEEKKLPLNWDSAMAKLHVEIAKLHFRGNTFQNVTGTADYQRGVLNPYDLKLKYGESDIQAGGTLDLRDPGRIGFDVKPDIKNLPLQAMKALFGVEKVPIRGPLSVTGHIKGRTGSTSELLTSLTGNLEAEIGQGTYLETGATTNLLSRILSVTKIQSILTGKLLGNITSDGIPFDQIRSMVKLGDGNLGISAFNFISSAMNLKAKGDVDLLKQHLDIDVELEPFEIVDKALGLVPFAGKLGLKFTRYNIAVSGPVDNPRIRLGSVRKATDTIKKEEKTSKGLLRRLF